MESNFTFSSIAVLSGVMLVGALIPGISVLAVCARSAAFGLVHGIVTILGIVAGDIVFILIAIYGLSVLAGMMGNHFYLIKYLGGAYLVWIGIVLWRSKFSIAEIGKDSGTTLPSSFMTGLLITLGDQKAILFYLGFLPAFVDMPTISVLDTGVILLTAIVAVGGAKLFYAFMAHRVSQLLKNIRAVKAVNIAAGSVMIGAGAWLLATA
jgi:threonine/homoserine/homoserine lactone efflux protein